MQTILLSTALLAASSGAHLANFLDFGLGDVAVLVHVEEPEGPLQLHGGGLPRRGHVEGDDVLFEIQCSVRVHVKGAEDVLGIRLSVAVWEELAVDLLKLLLGDALRWTLPFEVFIPLDQLHLTELGAHFQFIQDFLGHGATLGVTHRRVVLRLLQEQQEEIIPRVLVQQLSRSRPRPTGQLAGACAVKKVESSES